MQFVVLLNSILFCPPHLQTHPFFTALSLLVAALLSIRAAAYPSEVCECETLFLASCASDSVQKQLTIAFTIFQTLQVILAGENLLTTLNLSVVWLKCSFQPMSVLCQRLYIKEEPQLCKTNAQHRVVFLQFQQLLTELYCTSPFIFANSTKSVSIKSSYILQFNFHSYHNNNPNRF